MRFNLIQSLRFWAALIVMCAHTLIFVGLQTPLPPELNDFNLLLSWSGGTWAVSLFFCISGFVITHAAQHVSARDFLVHRLLRIYPGYFLAVALVLGVKYTLWHSVPEGHLSLAGLSLVPFGQIPYPLSIEWTLIYEIFFYALFALVWILRSNRLLVIVVSAWMALIVIAGSFWPEAKFSERFPTWYTVLFSSRSLPFIFGVYAYFLYDRVTPVARSLLYVMVPAGAFAVALFKGVVPVMLSTSLSVFALLLVVAKRASEKDAASDSVLVQYGNYSYGLYLVHISVITILLALTSIAQRPLLLCVTVLILMSLVIGLSFGAVENAMYRRLKQWYRARARVGWRAPDPAASLSKA